MKRISKNALLGSDKVLLLITTLVLSFLSCQKNYYTQIMQDGTCIPDQLELTQQCHDSIVNLAPIDVASFDGHQDVLDSVVAGIHTLLTAPIKLPHDKKMFGLATLKEAKMDDFI